MQDHIEMQRLRDSCIMYYTSEQYLRQKEELIYFGSWPNGLQMHAALYKYVLSHSVSTVTKTDGLLVFFVVVVAAHIKSRQTAVQMIGYGTHTTRTINRDRSVNRRTWTTAPEILTKYIVAVFCLPFRFHRFDRKGIIVYHFLLYQFGINGWAVKIQIIHWNCECVCKSCQIGTHNLNEIKPSFLRFL